MVSPKVVVSEPINELLVDDIAFVSFIDENIELLLKSKRTYIISSKEGIPPILFKKDEDGIWIAFINELQST